MYPTLWHGRSRYDILAALNPGHSIVPDMHCKPVKYQMNLQIQCTEENENMMKERLVQFAVIHK